MAYAFMINLILQSLFKLIRHLNSLHNSGWLTFLADKNYLLLCLSHNTTSTQCQWCKNILSVQCAPLPCMYTRYQRSAKIMLAICPDYNIKNDFDLLTELSVFPASQCYYRSQSVQETARHLINAL